MSGVPTIKGKNGILRKIRESDIDDRFTIGRHHEFVHMCGGESIDQTEYPNREVWVNWYESQKDAEYSLDDHRINLQNKPACFSA